MTNPNIQSQFDSIWGSKAPVAGAPPQSRANEIRSMAGSNYTAPTTAPTTDIGSGLSQSGNDISYKGTKVVGGLVGSMLKPVVGAGIDTASAITANSKNVADLNSSKQAGLNLQYLAQKQIAEDKAAGKDTSSLERLLTTHQQMQSNLPTTESLAPALNKSNEQVVGDFVGTGVAALSGGGLSAAGESLAAPTLAGVLGTGAKVGGAFGAASGVGGAMSDNQSTGDVVKSGLVGGAEGAAIGAGTAGILHGAGAAFDKGLPTRSTSAVGTADLTSQGIKDATPTNWKSVVGEPAIKNADGTVTPRINEASGMTPRTVNPNAANTAAGTELAKLDGYSKIAGKKSTSLTKAQFVDNAIATKGKALDASLANEHVLRPPKELNNIIKTAVMDTADKSQLLSKTDPMVKNYLRSSQRIVNASDGTLAGERQVVLKLDQAYEDAGGKYSNNKPLDQIHRSARQSLINDMESKAQNTQVKASLKEMENLYHANDILWDNAKAEGGTQWQQFQKAHPAITHVIKTGANALKLGGVIKGAEAI